MNALEHADRILTSWERSDSCLQDELLYALATCRADEPTSAIEAERRELLQSAVEHLRSLRGSKPASPEVLSVPLTLLEHLRQQLRTKTAGAS